MTHLCKWIRRNQSYSTPLFGTMVILAGMIFPVFHASAAIEEPVQPMAQTAEQVVDALNAVEAGTSVDEAFMIQPVPYRNWVKTQKLIYESLFGSPYNIFDAEYFLDEEVSQESELTAVAGTSDDGEEFSLQLSLLAEVANTGEGIPADIAAHLADVGANDFGFTGTISTASASFHITGSIFQGTNADGTRNRLLLIVGLVDAGTRLFFLFKQRQEWRR